MLPDEIRYKILKIIDQNPSITQRELADELGVSLGKANYCIKALVGVGLVKGQNFARSNNKMQYAYILTPAGLKEKAAVALRFLKSKQEQYDLLRKEIEQLKQEINS